MVNMTTKYDMIKQDLIQKILSGFFKPGDKIYSQSEIKEKYNVSTTTVVKALQDLVSEGYIFRYQGLGSFVSKRKRNELVKFSDLEFSPDAESVKVLSVREAGKNEVPESIEKNDYLIIERVKINGKVPYNYIKSLIPKTLVKSENQVKSKLSSVYDRVFLDSGIDLLKQLYRQTVKIIYPLPEGIGKILKLNEGPVVKQVMSNYSIEGKLLEYTTSYKRWDYYSVQFESPNMP